MKKNAIFRMMSALLLTAASASPKLYGQQSLDYMIEKASVVGADSKTVFYRPDRTSPNRVESVQIEVSVDDPLFKEFAGAFDKERPNACTVLQKTEDGKFIRETLVFYRDSTMITYSRLSKDENTEDIIRTKRPGNKPLIKRMSQPSKERPLRVAPGSKFIKDGRVTTVEEAMAKGYDLPVRILPADSFPLRDK